MRSKLTLLLLGVFLLLSGCHQTEQQGIPSGEAPSVEVIETTTPPETEPPQTTAATETTPETTEPQQPFVYHGLTELSAWDDSILVDQRYATAENFTGMQQYDRTLCLVNEDIVPMLMQASELAREHGFRLKIWDAYRPISVQQALHDSAPAELSAYVPAPGPYSMHARGITVDVTLCDMYGNELDMPTAFDDFSVAAHSDYTGASAEQIANRELLNEIMSTAGFTRSRLEWWHFDGPNRDNYEILDISFQEFEEAKQK